MTTNEFIECKVCSTYINLRIQLGSYDIEHIIECPECNTLINVLVNIERNNGDFIKLKNAKICDQKIELKKFYSIELVTEFFSKKMYIRDMENFTLTPFLRNSSIFEGQHNPQEVIRKALNFSDYSIEKWDKLISYYDLLLNNQIDYFIPLGEKLLKENNHIPLVAIKNELDSIIIIHQILLTSTGLSSVLPSKTLNDFIFKNNLIFSRVNEFYSVFEYFDNFEDDILYIEKKGLKLIDNYKKIYKQLIPLVLYRNANKKIDIELDDYGLTTANYNELSDFYALSYEWILENIDIIIILNNIHHRGLINNFPKNEKMRDFKRSGKNRKLDFIDFNEEFSKDLSSLKNRIRNSIQHYDHSINYINQEITFRDKFKGKVKTEKLYLVEFADLCIDNFCIVMYIIELIYILKKLKLVVSKRLVPSAEKVLP